MSKKTHKVGSALESFLKAEGFTHHLREETRVQYFTNSLGNQVKVDYIVGAIVFINNTGDKVDSNTSFTSEEILEFANTVN